MRNLLAIIGALIVGFAAVGWYLGWYKLNVSKTPDGNLRVETNVNTEKVVKDTGDGATQVGELIGAQLEKARQDGKTDGGPTPGTLPGPQPEPKSGTGGGWWIFDQGIGAAAAKGTGR